MQPTGRTRKAIYSTYDYDVWGNEEDGYEVNDVFCINRAVEFTQEEFVYNNLTCREVHLWEVSEKELADYFGFHPTEVEVSGDDEVLYVDREDGMPVGEIRFERLVEEGI